MSRKLGIGAIIIMLFLIFVQVGCNPFGANQIEQIISPAPSTERASVKFVLLLPSQNKNQPSSVLTEIRPATSDTTSAIFQIRIPNSGNKAQPYLTLSQTVPVSSTGEAKATFPDLPVKSIVGQLEIENGHVGIYSDFHGAIDLAAGPNELAVVPVGYGSKQDVVAHVVETALQSSELTSQSDNQLTEMADAIINILHPTSSNPYIDGANKLTEQLNPPSFVRLTENSGKNALQAFKSAQLIWEEVNTVIWPSGTLWDKNPSDMEVDKVFRHGLEGFGIVGWKHKTQVPYGIVKIDSSTGAVLGYCKNLGYCNHAVVMPDGSVVVGGTDDEKKAPVLFHWAGNGQNILWTKYFYEVKPTSEIPNPSVFGIVFDGVDTLTTTIYDSTYVATRTYRVTLSTGQSILTYFQAKDLIPPTILDTTPPADGVDIASNSSITVYFSEMMDPFSIMTSTIFLKLGETVVLGTVKLNTDQKSATFVPSTPLADSTIYTAYVTTGVRDLSGNPLANSRSWSFTTSTPFSPASGAKLAGGMYHSTAIKNDGSVWVWGWNTDGELGDGTNVPQSLPKRVSNLPPIVSIANGWTHTIALTSAGNLLAWGGNDQGQLGIGSKIKQFSPVSIPNLTRVSAIACGSNHSLAVSNGEVWTWGLNSSGQLGNGGTTTSLSPVKASDLSDVIAVSAGLAHSIALKSDGTVWTWGSNDYGQLGDGTQTPQSTPIKVPSLSGIKRIAAGGYHCLAIKSDDTVVAWGWNGAEQLGVSGINYSTVPRQVENLSGIIAVAAGDNHHSLALKSDGTVWGWGNNGGGQLGNGNTTQSSIPVQAVGISDIIAIAAGSSGHSMALQRNGMVFTWGNGGAWQLGDGNSGNRTTPLDIPLTAGASNVNAVASDSKIAISWNTVSEASAYNLYWSNSTVTKTTVTKFLNVSSPFVHANLTNGTTYNYLLTAVKPEGEAPSPILTAIPQLVPNNSPYANIVYPGDNSKYTPGSNIVFSAQVGDSDGSVSKVEFYEGASKIGEGAFGGSTITWYNVPAGNYMVTAKAIDDKGAFGISSPILIIVAPPVGVQVTVISGGGYHTIAMESDGSIWAWGANGGGQLGDGTSCWRRPTPYQISFFGATAFSCGPAHNLAIKADGSLYAWGSGCLGDGVTTKSIVPLQIPGFLGIKAVFAGQYGSFAVASNGSLLAWGNNSSGFLLGVLTDPVSVATPTTVPGLSGVVSAAMGVCHGLALLNDGTVWAWGNNYQGQLGDGGPLEVGGLNPSRRIQSLSNIAAIGAWESYSYALDRNGYVWTWGSNGNGQLGDGTTTTNSTPRKVPNLNGVIAIAGGDKHLLALKSDGTIKSWGNNGCGQVGNNSTTVNCLSPVAVSNLSDVISIGAGGQNSYAITNDKKIWGWGYNGDGELGNASTTNSLVPIQILW